MLSIVGFTVETLPDLSPDFRAWLRRFEVLAISVFTFEYLLRLWIAEDRLGFVFSFFGIIDLLVILPFYLQFAVDLRSLRVFWLFRLFRLFKLVRYVDAVRRISSLSHGACGSGGIWRGCSVRVLPGGRGHLFL